MVETFDIRVEVQAPVNGSEAYNNGVPSEDFSVTIAGHGGQASSVAQFFGIQEPQGKSCRSGSKAASLTFSQTIQLHLF